MIIRNTTLGKHTRAPDHRDAVCDHRSAFWSTIAFTLRHYVAAEPQSHRAHHDRPRIRSELRNYILNDERLGTVPEQ